MTDTALIPSRRAKKAWAKHCLAGYRSARVSPQTGTLVLVLHAGEAGLEDDPSIPWATVCHEHSRLVCHETRSMAEYHASDPKGWCEVCSGSDTDDSDWDPWAQLISDLREAGLSDKQITGQ